MSVLFDRLEQSLIDSGRGYDTPRIRAAFELADKAHDGQFRRSGEPYIDHPVHVATLLFELGMDSDSVIAALLHDVVEDTETSLEYIAKQFGEDVAQMVDGVTKLGQMQYYTTREDVQAENVRKMLLAMNKDIRVILIKLCDRLHNMRTMDSMPPQKQRDKSLETMEVYAPIAHRLGISSIKEELEDLALKYLDPYGYEQIVNYLKQIEMDHKEFLQVISDRIREKMADSGFSSRFEISGRVKSIYGIYRKVFISGRLFEQIYDIFAVRIITESVADCYGALGLVHDLFTPIANRFKDYISTPKPNMYQSLHTTVISKEQQPFEIQIRTFDMHHHAEFGIAAHWKYKSGVKGKDKFDQKLEWIRHLLENQKEADDAQDIIRNIKTDLSMDEVYAFTPRGDIKILPRESTVIDFAYAIHSAVGNAMVGAKVNGRIVSLDYKVQNNDIIEILTSKAPGKGPSRDWLKLVKTGEARNKIRTYFKKTQREENVLEGKLEVEREFKNARIILDDKQQEEFILELGKRHQCSTADDFYAALGYGGIALANLMPRIKELYQKKYKPEPEAEPMTVLAPTKRHTQNGIEVEGIDNCLVKLSKCCNPVPGDDIVGFITRGFGVSVHKADCPNVIAAKKQAENEGRWVNVYWANVKANDFKSTIEIVAFDRGELLADISVALAQLRVPIYAVNARALGNGYAICQVTVGIFGTEHLQTVFARIKKIKGVESVERVNA